jgi:hypothetical protein
MPERPERASHQLSGLATASPQPPRGPFYPNIPQQWSGPDGKSSPPEWYGPPPAGLDAPMPVPRTHPIRNTVLGLTALLTMVVVLGSLVSSVGVAPSPGFSSTIRQWQDNGGLDRAQAVLNDLEATEAAGKARDLAGMGRACRSLHFDAEAATAYTPIPDSQAQMQWAAALEHLTHASSTCVTAIRNGDADLFAQALDEMSAVPADVSEVASRLAILNR